MEGGVASALLNEADELFFFESFQHGNEFFMAVGEAGFYDQF